MAQRGTLSKAEKKIHTDPMSVAHNQQTKHTPLWTVPFYRDEDYITNDILEKVHQICAKPAGRAALVGLSGVG